MELAKLSGAVTVPVGVIAALFYTMMNSMLKPLQDDIRKLREDAHAIDVRLARVEEVVRIAGRLPTSGIGMSNPSVSEVGGGTR